MYVRRQIPPRLHEPQEGLRRRQATARLLVGGTARWIKVSWTQLCLSGGVKQSVYTHITKPNMSKWDFFLKKKKLKKTLGDLLLGPEYSYIVILIHIHRRTYGTK